MSAITGQNLPKQFVIAKTIPPAFDEWIKTSFEDWIVASAAGVPVISVVDATGKKTGLLIGWVVSKGDLLKDGETLEMVGREAEIDKFTKRLCGRFVFLFSAENNVSITVDAGGLLPVVYNRKFQALASTPTALSAFGKLKPDKNLQASYRIPERKGWYPFGLTPYQHIYRVAANHHFSLTTWTQKRVWPSGEIKACAQDEIPEIVKKIADCAASNIGGIVKGGTGFVHLTAGYDSRMVLAACRSYLDNCVFETVRLTNQGTELDCFVASALARKFNLKHEFLDFIEPKEADITDWLERSSSCVYDAVTLLSATVKLNDRHYHSITGTCGEVARSYYWAPRGSEKPKINAALLLAKMKVPATEDVLRAAEDWLSGLPTDHSTSVLDLAYIEQRLAGWAGPSVYGHDIQYPSLSPFNSLEIYELMLSLPEDYRQTHQFIKDYMDYLWPELMAFPFNRAFGVARLKFFKAEIRDFLPPKIRKFIKSMM